MLFDREFINVIEEIGGTAEPIDKLCVVKISRVVKRRHIVDIDAFNGTVACVEQYLEYL